MRKTDYSKTIHECTQCFPSMSSDLTSLSSISGEQRNRTPHPKVRHA